jgi:hypothetical protein
MVPDAGWVADQYLHCCAIILLAFHLQHVCELNGDRMRRAWEVPGLTCACIKQCSISCKPARLRKEGKLCCIGHDR